jgi:4-carboxymuconolactone decarboxylase
MDKDIYDRGMAMRRKVLGDAYVDRAMEGVDDFNRDFQRIVTQYGWGETWGDPTLTPRERSILNLGMIAALGKMQEFETHTRGALRNGLSANEVRAVLTQIAAYCGLPVGVDCFLCNRVCYRDCNSGHRGALAFHAASALTCGGRTDPYPPPRPSGNGSGRN